jgi:hypothetical protein
LRVVGVIREGAGDVAPGTGRAVLIEHDESLLLLNSMVLEAAGFEVQSLPQGDDAVDFVARMRPDVIVIHLDEQVPHTPRIVDRLQDNAVTQGIPICVIATSDKLAAEAQASPNVPVSVIAPFDLDALERAIAEALDSPPASAVLPNPPQIVPSYVAVVGEALNRNARRIVLDVVFRRLRQREPYRTLFYFSHDQLIQLVDHLGTILGAIVSGLQRELDPAEVFETPKLVAYIDEHIQLRRRQGLDVRTAVGEYQLLRDQCLTVVQEAVTGADVTAAEAVDAVRRILGLVDVLIRVAIERYEAADAA